jgi:hypothetical protein
VALMGEREAAVAAAKRAANALGGEGATIG